MTYKEAYMNCKTIQEFKNMVKDDIAVAMIINKDRLKVIKDVAEEVENIKFNKEELDELI